MTDWLILVESESDLKQTETPHKVMRVSDYLTSPALFAARRPYVLNLARSYAYQGAGYYAALLAEARGHRVSPTVQTMVGAVAQGSLRPRLAGPQRPAGRYAGQGRRARG